MEPTARNSDCQGLQGPRPGVGVGEVRRPADRVLEPLQPDLVESSPPSDRLGQSGHDEEQRNHQAQRPRRGPGRSGAEASNR